MALVFDGSPRVDGLIPGHLSLFLTLGRERWARAMLERNGFLLGTCRVCLTYLSLSGVDELTLRRALGTCGGWVAAAGIREVCLHQSPLFWGLGDVSFPNHEV